MTWHVVAGALILAVPVGGWLFFAIRNHKNSEKPKPTPWADSTKVAQQVREMEFEQMNDTGMRVLVDAPGTEWHGAIARLHELKDVRGNLGVVELIAEDPSPDTLIATTRGEEGKTFRLVMPGLPRLSWTPREDDTLITHVHPGQTTWRNGEPVTADDEH